MGEFVAFGRAGLFAVAISVGTAITSDARAQSLTGNVGSASIDGGESAIEFRVGVNNKGDSAARFHYQHAFSDWYQLRTIVAFARPDGADWDYSGLTFENWLQWREEADDDSGFNGGLRLAYAFRDGGGPDEAEVRLVVTDAFADRWEWRANLLAGIETGDGSKGGVALESRAQLSRDVASMFGAESTRLGAELFSEYGNSRDFLALEDQVHQLGPVIKLEWSSGLYLHSAARFALTDATDDAMLRLFVGRDF